MLFEPMNMATIIITDDLDTYVLFSLLVGNVNYVDMVVMEYMIEVVDMAEMVDAITSMNVGNNEVQNRKGLQTYGLVWINVVQKTFVSYTT